jgi:hypothetical protein
MRSAEAAFYRSPGWETRAAWDNAAADYYVALHPDESKWRKSGSEQGIPSIDEIRQRAAVADRANKGIPKNGRLDPDPDRHDEWSAQLGWFHETQRAVFTDDFLAAYAALRESDPSGLGYCIRFLEADPWCFRSGYMKSQLIGAISRFDLDEAMRSRLAVVVLAVVDDPRPRREIRRYGTLAHAAMSPDLRTGLEQRAMAADPQVRFNARQVLDRLARMPETETEGPRTG